MTPTDVILTAALTGPLATRRDNPALPVTPEAIASDAHAAWRAGASVVHIHLRDRTGRATADPGIGRATLDAVRERCPALIQLSTGVGLDVPFEAREKLVELRPEMATLNVASMTFAHGQFLNPPDGVRRLAARMRELEIKPEIEIYDFGHLELALTLLREGLLDEPLQFSLVMGVSGGVPARAEHVVSLANRMPESSTWQVIGIGRSHTEMIGLGLSLGANARTGLEDTLRLPDGSLAPSNAALVELLAGVARALHRNPVSPDTAAEILGLPSREVLATTSGPRKA
jgi:3-keto-5-aminohexanoate cleavage enzyme